MDEKEIIQKAFPYEAREEVNSLLTKFNIQTTHPTNAFEKAFLAKQTIDLPTRIYYKPPHYPINAKLTQTEKDLLNCIFSRHHDGYIRQKAIQNILHSQNDWAIPYLVRIIGEYVIQILEDINNHFQTINAPNLTSFIRQNPEFYNRTRSRVSSYWNCYYRHRFSEKLNGIRTPEQQRYVGFQLLSKIDRLLIES